MATLTHFATLQTLQALQNSPTQVAKNLTPPTAIVRYIHSNTSVPHRPTTFRYISSPKWEVGAN